ncbi:hypothetical protein KEM55_006838, partial [Ascosphaera atra]
MTVPKPVILNSDPSKPQIIRVAAKFEEDICKFHFYTEVNGRKTTHAQCVVKYGDPAKWIKKWNKNAHLVLRAIERLEQAKNSSVHRLGCGLVYKLFSSLVNYSDEFRGMDEVFMDASQFESVANITFKTPESEIKDYALDPRWIDNLCHISGFTVNGNETLSDDQVFISHGWDSLRFGEAIDHKKRYKSYVRMTLAGEGDVRAGDVYILEGDRIIGLAGGVKFQAVPKRVLSYLLPNDGPKPGPAGAARSFQAKLAASSTPAKVSSNPARAPVKKARVQKGPMLAKALDILAEECGAKLSELTDDVSFADLGVDSLMALTIISRFREELDIGLDSSFFLDNKTISSLRQVVCDGQDDNCSTDESSESAQSGTVTPQSSAHELGETCEPAFGGNDTIAFIRALIAEELGMTSSEIKDDTDLTEMGLDSLSVLSITAKLRETLESVNFPDDVLSCYGSLNGLIEALGIQRAAPAPAQHVE